MAQGLEMHPQLVRAARHWFELEPGPGPALYIGLMRPMYRAGPGPGSSSNQ